MRRSFLPGLLPVAFALLLGGCLGAPEGAEPVRGFEADRYMGRWYEIARLDHSFERGLEQVTATYALNKDGTVSVLNRGYDPAKGEWNEAAGKAKFAGAADVGALKVSFFGPFYGAYNVIDLDPDYQRVLVVGPNLSYLWILARSPSLPPDELERLTAKAGALGFDTASLIRVRQCATGNGGADCQEAAR
jgi:apolipoprotein D and lipocalin family protein